MSRAVDGEENVNDTWLAFYRRTGLALKQRQVAVIRLDHSGKDETKGMRGGSAKYGDVDAVWRLSKVTEDTFRLTCTDRRMRIVEDDLTLTRLDGPLRHEVRGDGYGARKDALTADMVARAARNSLAEENDRRDVEDRVGDLARAHEGV